MAPEPQQTQTVPAAFAPDARAAPAARPPQSVPRAARPDPVDRLGAAARAAEARLASPGPDAAPPGTERRADPTLSREAPRAIGWATPAGAAAPRDAPRGAHTPPPPRRIRARHAGGSAPDAEPDAETGSRLTAAALREAFRKPASAAEPTGAPAEQTAPEGAGPRPAPSRLDRPGPDGPAPDRAAAAAPMRDAAAPAPTHFAPAASPQDRAAENDAESDAPHGAPLPAAAEGRILSSLAAAHGGPPSSRPRPAATAAPDRNGYFDGIDPGFDDSAQTAAQASARPIRGAAPRRDAGHAPAAAPILPTPASPAAAPIPPTPASPARPGRRIRPRGILPPPQLSADPRARSARHGRAPQAPNLVRLATLSAALGTLGALAAIWTAPAPHGAEAAAPTPRAPLLASLAISAPAPVPAAARAEPAPLAATPQPPLPAGKAADLAAAPPAEGAAAALHLRADMERPGRGLRIARLAAPFSGAGPDAGPNAGWTPAAAPPDLSLVAAAHSAAPSASPRRRDAGIAAAARRAAAPPPAAPASAEAAPIRVVIHHLPAAAAQARSLAARLRAEGLAPGGLRLRPVPATVRRSDLRMFHGGDRTGAARIAAALPGIAAPRDFTAYRPAPRPGLVELWLAD